jgi:hypothetical protein
MLSNHSRLQARDRRGEFYMAALSEIGRCLLFHVILPMDYCTRLLLRQHLAKPNLPGRLIRQASAVPLPPVTAWWARPARSAAPPRAVASRERGRGSRAVPGPGALGSARRWLPTLQTMDRAVNGPCRPTDRRTGPVTGAWPSLAGASIDLGYERNATNRRS